MDIYISDVSLERCKVGKSGFIACHWMCLLLHMGVAYLLKIEENNAKSLLKLQHCCMKSHTPRHSLRLKMTLGRRCFSFWGFVFCSHFGSSASWLKQITARC